MEYYQHELGLPEVEPFDISLNPRSGLYRDYRTALKRASVLDELCRRHLELSKGDIQYARNNNPITWGSIDKQKGGPANPRTLLDQAFTDKQMYLVRQHWEWVFMTWYTGGLARQVRALEANLREDANATK